MRSSDPPAGRELSAAERYRQHAFQLASAAQRLSEMALVMAPMRASVPPAALADIDLARRLLADLPELTPTKSYEAKPQKRVKPLRGGGG